MLIKMRWIIKLSACQFYQLYILDPDMLYQPVAQIGKHIELCDKRVGMQLFVKFTDFFLESVVLVKLAVDSLESIVGHHLLFRAEVNLRIGIQRLDQAGDIAYSPFMGNHLIKVVDQIKQVAVMLVDHIDPHAQIFIPGNPYILATSDRWQGKHLFGVDDV